MTSTYRPPGRCSAPCVGRPQRRTHRPQPYTPHLRSLGRKPRLVLHRPLCAGFPRRPPLRLRLPPSQKRTLSRSGQRRKRQGNGQRRYMSIRARYVDASFISQRVTGMLTPRTCFVRSLQEASDLSLQAGERVRVTEKTSSDWCVRPKLSAPDLRMLIIIIQVDWRGRRSKWTLSRVICQASVAVAACSQTHSLPFVQQETP